MRRCAECGCRDGAWLAAKEVASDLGLSVASVRRYVAAGMLVGQKFRPGSPWRISHESLHQLLDAPSREQTRRGKREVR